MVSTASLYIKKGDYIKKEIKTIMPIVTNNQYRVWLKSAANMKLSSDASVLNITYEGLTILSMVSTVSQYISRKEIILKKR